VITATKVEALLRRGVVMPCPASVEVGAEVEPERIAPGVVIHTGCKILGARTSIGPGSELGAEAPATIEDCQLGQKVALKGGYFSGATFLDGANMGSGAYVRPGTLLEEEACAAHSVGFKQTILFPFVTAGSLINFCDALMAGGTSRKDHSEIGSSYIHFNFTPHQDKATPSMIGDVPGGVMLDRAPIFLGGEGGLAGPVRIAYGTVIPAGIICRQDIAEEGTLYVPPSSPESRAFRPGAYRSIDRIVGNNLTYIGNVRALQAWYTHVRKLSMARDRYDAACHRGALVRIDSILDERIERLGELSERMTRSIELARTDATHRLPVELIAQQQALLDRWPEIESRLRSTPPVDLGANDRDAFLQAWRKAIDGRSHTDAIASLAPDVRQAGSRWLQSIVDSVSSIWTASPRPANT